MKSFPMFIRTSGRRVVIAGGGEQAAQKARLMLKTDARLVLLADTLDPELADLVASGRATRATTPELADFADTAMVFIATPCPATSPPAGWPLPESRPSLPSPRHRRH